jgi:hypothetical protein
LSKTAAVWKKPSSVEETMLKTQNLLSIERRKMPTYLNHGASAFNSKFCVKALCLMLV